MGFFQEDNGNLSCVRLLSVIAMIAAIALAFYGASDVIIGMFLTASTVPKVMQKGMENDGL